ncbi:hypothetical protein [Clostridium weizhouense]|uniref:Carboxypeptidase regulatory-like domain-containing protein n=1 Tax=Clostridium weizhouense TaxID=2859781 RepID=A0ABS7AP38_9CLOT|nr:hypothetical protein [Clostridium weizhouense]MBW6409245.1 hypothetical protein [Clostridium weizhouense]
MNKNEFNYDEMNYLTETDNTSPYLLEKEISYNDDTYENNTNPSCLIGNSINFSIDENDNEIKADMIVQTRKTVRVWGQIMDPHGNKIPYAYVKLLKLTPNGLTGIAHTLTDHQGFYQFDICEYQTGNKYTIVVSKASTGCERIISTGLMIPNDDCDDLKDCY